jgi:hypothetical protein
MTCTDRLAKLGKEGAANDLLEIVRIANYDPRKVAIAKIATPFLESDPVTIARDYLEFAQIVDPSTVADEFRFRLTVLRV